MKKRLSVICAVAAIAMCFLVCNNNDEYDNFGSIDVTVTDRVSGAGILNASVTLSPGGASRLTDKNGVCRFEGLEVKDYVVSVQRVGCIDNSRSVTVIPGGAVQANFPMERHPTPLRLVDSDGSVNDITGLNFGSVQDVRSFSIYNDNPYALDWEIMNNTEWIIVNRTSGTLNPGGGQQPIAVTIDRSKQPEGVFSASISIISDAGVRDLAISTQVVSLALSATPAVGGTVSPTVRTDIAPGLQVNISASANTNYKFVNWMVTSGQAHIANDTNSVTTVILSSDASISAVFQDVSTGGPVTGQSLAAQLLALHANAESGGEYTITLTGNENIGAQPLTFADKSDITVRVVGSGGERIVQLTDNGSLFTVGTGVTLVLDDRVTLRGRSGNNSALVRVNARGALVMKAGAKISNNSNSNSGGGVFVATDGSFTLSGGEISSNGTSGYNSGGGGVYVASGGYFLMESGRISGNGNSSYSGGGVYVSGGTFIMRSGDIINNVASTGGGVEVGGGTFAMEGGRISGNTASTTSSSYGGGGVFVGSAAFTMSGGEISGNSARSGGGVFVVNNGTFSKTAGTIYGYTLGDSKRNTATAGITSNDKGHAVFVNSNPNKRRETTAGEELALDSRTTGAVGGWE